MSAAWVPGEAQSSGTPRRRGCLARRFRSAVPSRLLGGLGSALGDPEVGGDCVCQGKHVAGPYGPTARTTIAAILRIQPVAPDDPEGSRREDLLVCLVDVVHFSLHGRARRNVILRADASVSRQVKARNGPRVTLASSPWWRRSGARPRARNLRLVGFAFDRDVRQPIEPAWQPPVPVAQQAHRGRQ